MLIKVLGLNVGKEIGGHLFIRSGTNHVATKDKKANKPPQLREGSEEIKMHFFLLFWSRLDAYIF